MIRMFRNRMASRLRNCWKDETAAAAIEFALVTPMVFALAFFILALGVIYLARSQLDVATQAGARAVMVGSATSSDQLKTAICNAIGGLFTCDQLLISINESSSLSSMNTASPVLILDSKGTVKNTWGASFGASGSILVLQVMYQFPLTATDFFNLSAQTNGSNLLVSTAVFIKE